MHVICTVCQMSVILLHKFVATSALERWFAHMKSSET